MVNRQNRNSEENNHRVYVGYILKKYWIKTIYLKCPYTRHSIKSTNKQKIFCNDLGTI